jgi:FtsP/CotA-like multicopper oxidase with cupredoxin domain
MRTRRHPPLSERTAGRWWRLPAAIGVPLLLVVPLGWLWYDSLVPSTYSVMDMGHADYGGGPAPGRGGGHAGHDVGGVSLATLTGPRDGTPDLTATLTARQGTFELASGEQADGYTLNGTSPGPELVATEGDLVEVTLVNADVEDGVTLHWHGIDVPNAEDGVAGVTQDAVEIGEEHVYRFVLPHAGTYWYHSHQVSHRQVRGGLFGTFVVTPRDDAATSNAEDLTATLHTYDGVRTLNGRTGVSRAEAPAGGTVRLRVVNTDNGAAPVWVSGAAYRVLAVDGFDLRGPTDVRDRTYVLTAGARADLEVVVPPGGFRLDVGGGTAMVVGPKGSRPSPATEPERRVDLLTYGDAGELPFDPDRADRRFDYDIGRRPGFLDGRPGFWWTINGKMFPDVPMYVVEEGDVVRMTIKNTSGDVHPMHLHGHHAVVLSRNGVPASGSPWWVDSLHVADDETYEIAFLADNPGVWMDHCHNLPHAAEGLIAHLAYAGVSTPYEVGRDGDGAHNHPE